MENKEALMTHIPICVIGIKLLDVNNTCCIPIALSTNHTLFPLSVATALSIHHCVHRWPSLCQVSLWSQASAVYIELQPHC